MKVILTQDIDKLGNAGSLQEVKPGFARNYLIPNGLAQPATSGMIKQVEERQAAERRRIVKQENAMQSLSDRIQGMRLTFTARAGDTGRLFGSVTSADIAEQLSQQLGEEIDRRKVDLPGGIHEIGESTVTINLVGRLKPQITVTVNPEGGELVAAAETEAGAEESAGEESAETEARAEDAASDESTVAGDEEPDENEA